MIREKIEIKKENKIIIGLLERVENQKGLVIIMHGLGVMKEQTQLEGITNIFLDNDYSVIRFDAVNSIGESKGGSYEDATVTNYYEDLTDIIEWAKNQEFYQKPVLVGHSLGGMCVTLYAQENQDEIMALAPIAPIVSGEFFLSNNSMGDLLSWEKNSFLIRESTTSKGFQRKLKWGFAQDILSKSIITKADKLKIPVLLIIGEKDSFVSPNNTTIFYWKLKCPKEYHIISNAGHNFFNEELEKVQYLFDDWLKKLE